MAIKSTKNDLNVNKLQMLILPIVEIKVALKASSENLKRTQVFPTPLSPIRRSLNR